MANCELCGEPMPPGEEMFKFHGYSGNCPKPPLPRAPTEAERTKTERDELYGYVNGLLGLLQMLRGRSGVSDELSEIMRTNHRVIDAAAYLTQILPPGR